MLQRARRKMFWPFVLPAAVLYLAVFIIPMVQTIFYSFTNLGQGTPYKFVGLENYVRSFTNPFFWNAMKNTIAFTLIGGLLLFIPGLFLAWALAQPIRFKRLFRMVIFAPVVMSVLVAALLWKFLLNPKWGLVNNFLHAIGMDSWALPWLGDTRTALLGVTLATIWHGIGLWVVLMSAGLERIPPELYEAARVDGAKEWRQFVHITLPLMWEVLRSLIVLWVVQALQTFVFVFVMTKGGPLNTTEVAATYVYSIAFQSREFGYATALATLMMLIILVFTWVTKRVLHRRDTYEF